MKFATFAALAAASLVSAAEHRVKVGVDEAGTPGNFFTPSQIDAAEGDLVHFEFMGGNHTVTQGSFAVPCTQQFNTKTQLPGVDSGFVPANGDPAGPVPIWTVEVLNGKSPLWLFCNRNPHCSGAGMVFAINAPAEGERTFEKFLANAKAGGEQPGPGVFEDFTPPPPADAPAPDAPADVVDPAIQPDGQITDPALDPATQPDGQITDPSLDPAPVSAPQAPIGATDPALALPINPIGNSVIPASGTVEQANAAPNANVAGAAASSRVVSGVLVSLVGVVAAALF